MKTAVIGFPRIGEKRELKWLVEGFFKGVKTKDELLKEAKDIRKKHWLEQKNAGIDYISSNDFSFYDTTLDTIVTLNAIPKEYANLKLDEIDRYFALARGYQKSEIDIKALPMKKWFNTNYHYLVTTIDENTDFKLNSNKIFDEYLEASNAGIETKPVILGPFSFLKLAVLNNIEFEDALNSLVPLYGEIINRLESYGAKYIQIDEPSLVMDLNRYDIKLFKDAYTHILKFKNRTKILLQTYFGDVRDIYNELVGLDFDAYGLDFVEGDKTLELIKNNGFPKDKELFAGTVNGKNIWINDYNKSLNLIKTLKGLVGEEKIILNSSCSLLHLPYTKERETILDKKYINYLAFAKEKLGELKTLSILYKSQYENNEKFLTNQILFKNRNNDKEHYDQEIRDEIQYLSAIDFNRKSVVKERLEIQNSKFKFPALPTTTIGSFPQTAELRKIRRDYKNGLIDKSTYEENIKKRIDEVVKLQEDLDIDVLVHGEFERNDMVEYFGENLNGFIFSQNGWVQSYGTRGVKPPIIFGDVKRANPITVSWSKYAKAQTDRPMKGMLTGPVTILNWSFPREDLSLKQQSFQIGLAIRDEVLDLEKAGIDVIQIDEAALREKLPLRKADWQTGYLDWAIKSFRLTAAKVNDETQIHTHMCYSEFKDIFNAISDMDADVITIEAAKSDLSMLDVIKENGYDKEIGPGVYDIHSPRVPSVEELKSIINKMIYKIGHENLWVNPDCGLKTRADFETKLALKNMVIATKEIRAQL